MRYPNDPSLIWSSFGHHWVSCVPLWTSATLSLLLLFFWSSDGELAGIGSYATEHGTRQYIGSKDIFATSVDVQIPKESWITELVIVAREEIDEDDLNKIIRKIVGLRFIFSKGDPIQVGQAKGDVRVIYPESSHFVVGFQVAWAATNPISKIGLLFQPIKKAIRQGLDRLKPRDVFDEEGVMIALPNPETAGHLWRNDLPPRELDIVPLRNGFFRLDNTRDDLLVESLVFGTKESDLGMITTIGVDSQLRGFDICMENGHEKWTRGIGNRNAMQYLSIDGRGGERILYFYVYLYDVARGIRFVTNRERHLIVGEPDSDELRFPPEGHQHALILSWVFTATGPTEILQAQI